MTKDGIAEKVQRDLKQLYDSVTQEPIPPAWTRLLSRLG